MSSDLVDTTEMYLKAIYELEEEGVPPLRARLVERLDQSKPTVSETVSRLERAGLLTMEGGRSIALTERGRREATTVMRKHRLAERLLLEVIGVDWNLVHEEACRWEHVISDAVELKIASLLEEVATDPFGNPIPDEGSAGPGQTAAGPSGVYRVKEFLEQNPAGGVCEIARIGEVLQTDPDLLLEFREAGIMPHARISARQTNTGTWCVQAVGGTQCLELTAWIAGHLLIYR